MGPIEEEKKRSNQVKQYQKYQEQLDAIEAEKKEKTGSLGGKKAKVNPSGSSTSAVQDLFTKTKNKP